MGNQPWSDVCWACVLTTVPPARMLLQHREVTQRGSEPPLQGVVFFCSWKFNPWKRRAGLRDLLGFLCLPENPNEVHSRPGEQRAHPPFRITVCRLPRPSAAFWCFLSRLIPSQPGGNYTHTCSETASRTSQGRESNSHRPQSKSLSCSPLCPSAPPVSKPLDSRGSQAGVSLSADLSFALPRSPQALPSCLFHSAHQPCLELAFVSLQDFLAFVT